MIYLSLEKCVKISSKVHIESDFKNLNNTALRLKLKFCPHTSSTTYFSYPQYVRKIIAL